MINCINTYSHQSNFHFLTSAVVNHNELVDDQRITNTIHRLYDMLPSNSHPTHTPYEAESTESNRGPG